MSNTLDILQLMLADQHGKRSFDDDLDSPLQSTGFDNADLEELKIFIEEKFNPRHSRPAVPNNDNIYRWLFSAILLGLKLNGRNACCHKHC